MNDPKKTIKWIKILVDIFDDEKFKLIDSLPDRDMITVIWFKMLTLSGKSKHGGYLVLNDRIAYSDEMLSTVFARPLNTIRLALKTFEEFGMIEFTEERIIQIVNWEDYQSVDIGERSRELTRQRVLRFREKQKTNGIEAKSGENEGPAPCNVTVTLPTRYVTPLELELEVDLEEEKEKDLKAQSMSSGSRKKCDSDPCALSSLAEFWNATCPSLPAVREMSEKRRKKEKLRLKERPDLDQWERIFRMIHESSFCRGNGRTGWRATFDWIIDNPDNAIKVLEGKYGDCNNGRPKDISEMTDAEVVAFLNS